jgi:hypothetical protein
MLDGLAFLPVNDVSAGLDYLRTVMPSFAAMLVDYFDSTYVNGHFRSAAGTDVRRLVRPRFPPPTWNVHQITATDGDRTNNNAEAWNRRFECLLGHCHPSIWSTIEMLQADHAEAATTLLKHQLGSLDRKRQRRGVQSTQRRLARLCSEYVSKERTLEEFLRAVGNQIRLE